MSLRVMWNASSESVHYRAYSKQGLFDSCGMQAVKVYIIGPTASKVMRDCFPGVMKQQHMSVSDLTGIYRNRKKLFLTYEILDIVMFERNRGTNPLYRKLNAHLPCR
jgi:hypothetical protein